MNKSNLSTPKKVQGEKKEQFNHLPTHSITYNCVCGAKFETVSASHQNFSVSSCSQCNPFYTGAPAQEARVGAVARFRQKFESRKKN